MQQSRTNMGHSKHRKAQVHSRVRDHHYQVEIAAHFNEQVKRSQRWYASIREAFSKEKTK